MEYKYITPGQINVLYDNDLKFEKFTGINKNMVEGLQNKKSRDTLKYRLDENRELHPDILDFSHLSETLNFKLIPINIMHLFISNNDLKYIPSLAHLSNLETLDICSNKITKLPQLPINLTELTCKDNQLLNIDEIKYCKSIKRLDCSYNEIDDLPQLDTVEDVICCGNRLKSIKNYPNIRKLDCKNNLIENISSLRKIKILNCSYNKIKELGDFDILEALYCDNNKLEKIYSLNNLNFLNCYDNPLKYIPFFKNLTELICDYGKGIVINENYKIETTSLLKKKHMFVVFKK